MNPFAKYETDPFKELGGVPVQIDDMTFYIRHAGGNNRAYRIAIAKAAEPYRDQIQQNSDDVEKLTLLDAIEREAFADVVLIGWDNVDGRDNQPFEFSRKNAFDLISACPRIWDELKAAAIDPQRFRPDEDGQKLGESSAGGSNGENDTTSSNYYGEVVSEFQP